MRCALSLGKTNNERGTTMTKKILISMTLFAALSLMATTVLADPGERNERRHGWKKSRPVQVRIVPRAKNVRFVKIIKRNGEYPTVGYKSSSRIYNGRGNGNCPNFGNRY